MQGLVAAGWTRATRAQGVGGLPATAVISSCNRAVAGLQGPVAIACVALLLGRCIGRLESRSFSRHEVFGCCKYCRICSVWQLAPGRPRQVVL